MGAGNYIRHTYGYAQTFYVQMPYVQLPCEEGYEDEAQFAYETLKEAVLNALAPSYCHEKCNKPRWKRDALLLAENNVVMVLVADNQTSTAIVFETQKEEGAQGFPLHQRHVDLAYKRVAKHLLGLSYELYTRSSPWTSNKLELEDL